MPVKVFKKLGGEEDDTPNDHKDPKKPSEERYKFALILLSLSLVMKYSDSDIYKTGLTRQGSHVRGIFLVVTLLLLSACQQGSDTACGKTAVALREVGKLTLVEMTTEETFALSGNGLTLTGIRSLDEVATYINDLFKVGNRVGVYSFKRYVEAYIDLYELTTDDVVVDEQQHAVALTLPPVRIEQPGREVTLTTLYEHVSGTQAPIGPEERARMKNKASAAAKESFAVGTPLRQKLIQQAEQKAIAYFTLLMQSRGYSRVDIKIQREEGERHAP